jgi:hypothetical protein
LKIASSPSKRRYAFSKRILASRFRAITDIVGTIIIPKMMTANAADLRFMENSRQQVPEHGEADTLHRD